MLAFVDVDGLKAVNDSRGHAAGDLMLVEVCETLRAELGSHDLIIRYGGDEFVCAIAGVNATYATRRLALVNAALAKATEPGSVAVGIAELQPGDTAESLVARAGRRAVQRPPASELEARTTRPLCRGLVA